MADRNAQPPPGARAPQPGREVVASAVIDGPYRYDLRRIWDAGRTPTICAWVMLNPSRADENTDDPTVRRYIAYAQRWGFGGIVVRNLFALRATDPAALLSADDPIGPDNDAWLSERLAGVACVVVAWGCGRYPRLAEERWRRVAQLLAGHRLLCLRTGRDGQPVHPLYQPAGLVPRPWTAPWR
ncbi:DUF1643 domain-containing protein [Planobispora rosea]|uniref:DUF1643 domain-containing protein n=1 Tax=Planobispora rosea TaxID=35762 RepID=UPI001E492EC1|nr:DUF1643 domain-containing protein [Planobispora rosea]